MPTIGCRCPDQTHKVLAFEICCPDRHAYDQPPRRNARDLIDVVPWGDLRYGHPNHAPFRTSPWINVG